MSAAETTGIDLIRELRLRQWARAHYVADDLRSPSWHPVVLDEMRRRDEELLDSNSLPMMSRSMFVPLAPGSLSELAEAS